jgi:hypothetical protein
MTLLESLGHPDCDCDLEPVPRGDLTPCHGCREWIRLDEAVSFEGEWWDERCAWEEIAGLIEGELDPMWTSARSPSNRLLAAEVAEVLVARAKERIRRDAPCVS